MHLLTGELWKKGTFGGSQGTACSLLCVWVLPHSLGNKQGSRIMLFSDSLRKGGSKGSSCVTTAAGHRAREGMNSNVSPWSCLTSSHPVGTQPSVAAVPIGDSGFSMAQHGDPSSQGHKPLGWLQWESVLQICRETPMFSRCK